MSGSPMIVGGSLAMLGGCAGVALALWRGMAQEAVLAGGFVLSGLVMVEIGKRVPY
jgi:hypothetical protein